MKFQNPSIHCSQDMACIRFHSDFFKEVSEVRLGPDTREK